MTKVRLKKPFVNLESPGLTEKIVPFFMPTRVYEQELAQYNGGIDISSDKSIEGMTKEAEEHYRNLVPLFSPDETRSQLTMDVMFNHFLSITKPRSMIVENVSDLEKHILTAYQVSHAHYILAKKDKMGAGKFPDNSCGTAGRNVALALIVSGYPNAAYVYNNQHDHGYVIMPFVMKKKKVKGTIIVDPTSDQMWNLNMVPRNLVFVRLGDKWEYRTGWLNGADLFPDRILDLSTMRALHMLKVEFDRHSSYTYQDGQAYLKQAFSNPINIQEIRGRKGDWLSYADNATDILQRIHEISGRLIKIVKKTKNVLKK